MAQRLKKLVLKEVSLVPAGANQHAQVLVTKAQDLNSDPTGDANLDTAGAKPAADMPGTLPRKKAKKPGALPQNDTATSVVGKILAAIARVVAPAPATVTKANGADDGSAMDFTEAMADANADRLLDAVRSELWQYESALQTSIRTIIEDDAVADKKAAISAALSQFQDAVIALIPDMEAADAADPDDGTDDDGDVGKNGTATPAVITPEAGDAGQVEKDAHMTDTVVAAAAPTSVDIQKMIADEVAKALVGKDAQIAAQAVDIAKLLDDQVTKDLTIVAKGFSHLAIKPEDYVAVAKGLTPEATASLTTILTTANAALAGSKLFGEVGSVGKAADAETVENHPIVKAAAAAAEKAAKKAAA
jgi:hypothetical protein